MNELHHQQGFYIDQIQAYAKMQFPSDETGSVRCATFKDFEYVCKFISANESIPLARVYPALRYIGYNNRYHDMKCDNPDPLYEMGDLVKQCLLTSHRNTMDLATEDHHLFGNTTVSIYRIKSDAITVAMKDANACGVRVGELNMYNALEGLDVLMSNEPDYITMRDTSIFEDTLSTYIKIKETLRWKLGILSAGLNNIR